MPNEDVLETLRRCLEIVKSGEIDHPLVTPEDTEHVSALLRKLCHHNELEFQGHIAAPGFGVCWECVQCGEAMWSGSSSSEAIPYADLEQPPELSLEDII